MEIDSQINVVDSPYLWYVLLTVGDQRHNIMFTQTVL